MPTDKRYAHTILNEKQTPEFQALDVGMGCFVLFIEEYWLLCYDRVKTARIKGIVV